MDLARAYRLIGSAYSAVPRRLGRGYALPPLRVAIILTHRCNLRCAMCPVWDKPPGEGQRELQTDEILRIIGETPRTSLITFTGGEPFIRDDFWTLLETAARTRRVHLVSNGTLLEAEDTERLARLGNRSVWTSGLLSLGVSLEGPAEAHDRIVQVPGAHARTVETLRAMAATRTRLGRKYPYLDLKVVITRDTIDELEAIFELAEEVGADLVSYQMENTQASSYGVMDGRDSAHLEIPPAVQPIDPDRLADVVRTLQARSEGSRVKIRFNPAIPMGHLQKRYQNSLPLRGMSCEIAWTVLHVGPYGDVLPCYSYSMGNIREGSLMSIWNGARYRAFRNDLASARIWPGCVGCCVMRYDGSEETL